MTDKESVGRVLTSLLKEDGRAMVVIAKELSISQSLLSMYKSGKRFPNAKFFQKWKSVFGQDLMELIDSEKNQPGSSKSNREVITSEVFNSVISTLRESHQTHIEDLKKATSDTIETLRAQVEYLKTSNSELIKRL
jgi:predicted transcriptional regulator